MATPQYLHVRRQHRYRRLFPPEEPANGHRGADVVPAGLCILITGTGLLGQWTRQLYDDGHEVFTEAGIGAKRLEDADCELLRSLVLKQIARTRLN